MTVSNRLAECQRVIGYHFANPTLLEVALTHSSVRTPDRECNERLEFLGDSVLGLTITEELYKRLPDQQEGELTRIKSAVVSRGALYRVSTRLALTRFIEVAKGVSRKEELPVSLTANLVESIIGAIYLDAGFFPAREFILKNLGPEVEDVMNDRVAKNYKSLLQHEAQQLLGATPIYRTLEEEGPDHRKAFMVAAVVRGTEYGRASGINKKEAEQEAARHALEALLRRRGGRRRRGGLTLERLESRDLRDGRDYIVREPGSDDEGPAADDHGRGGGADRQGRPMRGARPLRGGRRRGREDVRPTAAQSKDDADWQAWAEGARSAPPATPRPEPSSSPSAPYVVGPEPEEAYFDAPPDAPRSRGATSDAGEIPVPLSTPVPVEQPDDPGPPPASGYAKPARSSESASGSDDAPDDGPPGRRRRGRRGGRRSRATSADAASEHEAPFAPTRGGPRIAPEADEGPAQPPSGPTEEGIQGIPAAFIAPEPTDRGSSAAPPAPASPGPEPSSWPDFGAEPAPAARPARRAREPRGRGAAARGPAAGGARERAPRERGARRSSAAEPTSAPAPAREAMPPPAPNKPAPTLPGFGAGILGNAPSVPPPRAAAAPAVPKPAVEIPAVKKLPKAPAPPKPNDGGGFGAGLV